MDFVVSCPACGLKLSVSQENLGREGKCSGCGTVFTVDRPGGRPDAESPSPPFRPPAPPEADHPYAPPRSGEEAWSAPPAAEPGLVRLADGLSRGFEMLHANIGSFLVIGVVFTALQIGLALPQLIPYLGPVFGLALSVCVAPHLLAGLTFAALKQHDGGSAETGDLFAEFSNWGAFALLGLIEIGMYLVALLPAGFLFGMFAAMAGHGGRGPEFLAPMLLLIVLVGYALVVTLFVNMILCWAYPALIDRRAGVMDALQTSWALMKRNFLATLATVMLALLLRAGGMFLCCVGLIYAAPAAGCLVAATYRTAMPSAEGVEGPGAPIRGGEDDPGDEFATTPEPPEYP